MKLDKNLNEFLKKNSKFRIENFDNDLMFPSKINVHIWLMKYNAGKNQTLFREFNKINNLSQFGKFFELVDGKFDIRNYWYTGTKQPNKQDYEFTIWL